MNLDGPDKTQSDATAVGDPHEESDTQRLTRAERRAETRARLLRSAVAVFAERGFYGASVEDIAERAGFTRGAFYSNFQSKDDVFLALLDHHIAAELRALEEALGGEFSPETFLDFLQTRGSSHEARRWALLWAEFWLHVVRHPELAPKLATRQQAVRAAIAGFVKARSEQAGISLPVPASDVASLIIAVDEGLKLQEYLDPAAIPADLRLRAMLLLFNPPRRSAKPRSCTSSR